MKRMTRSQTRGGPVNPGRNRPHPGQSNEGNGPSNGQRTNDLGHDEHLVISQLNSEGHLNASLQIRGPPEINKEVPSEPDTNLKRVPWTKADMKEIMWCYYLCEKKGMVGYLHTYKLWRERNPHIRLNIDANKLQNQKRYILQNNKLNSDEIQDIKQNIENYLQAEQNRIREETQQAQQTEMLAKDDSIVTDNNTLDDLEQEILKLSQLEYNNRNRLPKLQINKESLIIINKANTVLGDLLLKETQLDITRLNNLVYATALYVTNKLIDIKPNTNTPKRNNRQTNIPAWQHRIVKKIEEARRFLSILVEIRNGANPKSRIKLPKKYSKRDPHSINIAIEELKQIVAAKTQRLHRYKKRKDQYIQNRLFSNDPKKFYRSLKEGKIEVTSTPTKIEIEEYWKSIFENDKQHNNEAQWIKMMEQNQDQITNTEMDWQELTTEEITIVIKKLQGWKCPGNDKIHAFWYKKLTCLHEHLAKLYNNLINNTTTVIPEWLTEGNTYLLAKNLNTHIPKNYRPITCLNTAYKILTSAIAHRIGKFVQQENIIAVEQKGCCKSSMGCKDQLLYSKAILEDCQKHKKSLQIGWIDYQKAYDSVPHSWITKSMELIGISNNIIQFCRKIMSTWNTKLHLHSTNETIITDTINIKCGIFQGDSLSPLLFCIALNPLSKILNNLKAGYKISDGKTRISHLLYMDDLKVIADSKAQLRNLLQKTKEFSDDIGMKFGVEKCAIASFKKGQLEITENLKISNETTIKAMEHGDIYKYLGIEEKNNLDHSAMKYKLKQEYLRRVRKILKTELTSKNKFHAIGALAVPVLQYSFGIIDWRLEEIQQIDRKTRKLLTIYKILHPCADIDRIYVSRSEGGRGLQQIEAAYNLAIAKLSNYINNKASTDYIVESIRDHEENKPEKKSLTKKARKFEIKLFSENHSTPHNPTQIKTEIKHKIKTNWLSKPLHGQLHKEMNKIYINSKLSYGWMKYGDLKGETESLLTAAQDQAIRTRYIEKKIYKTRNDALCRICNTHDETISHIMTGCSILARKEYLERHNKVCAQLHFSFCQHYKCDIPANKWYQHNPENITTNADGSVTILYDHPITTDRTVMANRPDIVIREKNITYVIDVSIPADQNIIGKEAEKVLKYSSLDIEIKRMWNTKTQIIPVVIGATGYVSANFSQHLEKLPGTHNAAQIQKTAILGTAHIIRKVLK